MHLITNGDLCFGGQFLYVLADNGNGFFKTDFFIEIKDGFQMFEKSKVIDTTTVQSWIGVKFGIGRDNVVTDERFPSG
jgi:hypothetical protein